MRNRIWIALHAVVVLVPVIGALAGGPDVPLFGVQALPERPTASLASWRTEKLQTAIQAWFESRLGFRGVMIRTDNTIQTKIVGDTKPSSTVIEGEHGTLYLKDDISFMNKPEADLPPVLDAIEVLAKSLGSVQRKLSARGKTVAVVIAPSKSAIYPEDVPARWRRSDGARSDLVVHEALVASLTRNGVKFSDGHLLRSQGAEREARFMRSARHWTTLGACLVVRDALAPGPATPDCTYDMVPIPWTDSVGGVDFDLERLLNVWRFGPDTVLVPSVRAPAEVPPPERRPRTVIVGTSFLWMMTHVLRPLLASPVAVYYNTTIYDVGTAVRPLGPVDESSPLWVDAVLDRDLYVLEVLETYAHGDHMLKFLQTLDRRLDAP